MREALVLNNLIFRNMWDNMLASMERGLTWLIIPTEHWGRSVGKPSWVQGDSSMRWVWHGKGTQRFALTSPSRATSVLCILLCQGSKKLSANLCPLFSLICSVPQPQLGFQPLPPFFS